MESERAHLRSETADFRSGKADSWPERPNGEGTNKQMDKQTNESPPRSIGPLEHRTLSPLRPLP